MADASVKAVRRRRDCRLCGGALELVFSLAPTPPANAFVSREDLHIAQDSFPLDLHLCRDCGHLQLLDVVDPGLLFRHYVYVSGTSPVFLEHFRAYAEDAVSRYGLRPGDLVVEIGSNDGSLLRFFREKGMRVLGVDPAQEIARAANQAGIETVEAFFEPRLAARIRGERGPAALVAANNVFAHADGLREMAEGVRSLLGPGGVFVFEVSYLLDVCEKLLFDTIYHEHLAYHAAGPLRSFFPRCGMEMIDARRVPTHGGSLRGVAQPAGGARRVSPAVGELIALEEAAGLRRPGTYRDFSARIDRRKAELGELLRGLKEQGKRIAGFGAPAKATTLMYHFGLGPGVIDFVVDDSPLKQGLFTPGHHIPVLPASALYERRPDYVLVLAWNFADPILAKHKAFAEAGGRFIVPLPDLRVI